MTEQATDPIETFWEKMNLPRSCHLRKRITKKLLLDNEGLKSADKKLIKEELECLYWEYTLKPKTINIAPYQTDDLDYGEIAVLSVTLRNPTKVKRLTELLQRFIPYPLVLLVMVDNQLRISLALKRKHLQDSQKLTVEHYLDSDWIVCEAENKWLTDFYNALDYEHYSWESFYHFYLAIVERLIAYQRAIITMHFQLNEVALSYAQLLVQKQEITDYYRQQTQIEALSKQAAKSKQMGKQVELNTHIHQLKYQQRLKEEQWKKLP